MLYLSRSTFRIQSLSCGEGAIAIYYLTHTKTYAPSAALFLNMEYIRGMRSFSIVAFTVLVCAILGKKAVN